MNRFVLVDGHAILHRAYHALPPLTTSKGELVNAVFGFTSMLLRVIHDLKPTYLVVTFDTPALTFRNKLFKKYQAKRPKMDEKLIPQVDIVHRVVQEMGIPIFELDGYEADDLIGSLVYQTKNINSKRIDKNSKTDQEIEIVIITGDRDMLQLVDEKTKVYMPVKGLLESKLYGEKEVEDKFGINPQQFIDYKALAGDQSDNYPGVPGIGPKTASGLLMRFKTLEQVYKDLGEIDNEVLRKKLEEFEESAELAKKLATIVTDAPIKLDLDKCILRDFDRPNVYHLFEELEFRSLIPRLGLNNKDQITKIKKQKNNKKENNQISLF